MTGGVIDSVELPDNVPVVRKPVVTAELIFTVREVLVRAAQLRANLALSCERSAELQPRNEELRSEVQPAIHNANEAVRKCRAQRLHWKKETES
jgi:hypothetical protein